MKSIVRCALLSLAALSAVRAQAGRMAVLAGIPGRSGDCMRMRADDDLRTQGVDSLFMLYWRAAGRMVTVSTGANRKPVLLEAWMTTSRAGQSETEQATVWFDAAGAIRKGERTYVTSGTTARDVGDQKIALKPTDSVLVRRLVAGVVQRCG